MARQTAGLLNSQTDNRSGSDDITSPPFPFSLPLFLPSFLPSPLFCASLSSFRFSISPFSISSGVLTGLLFLIYFSHLSMSLSPASIQPAALCSAASYPCCPGPVVRLGQSHTLKMNLFCSFRMKKQHNSKYCDKYLFCSY